MIVISVAKMTCMNNNDSPSNAESIIAKGFKKILKPGLKRRGQKRRVDSRVNACGSTGRDELTRSIVNSENEKYEEELPSFPFDTFNVCHLKKAWFTFRYFHLSETECSCPNISCEELLLLFVTYELMIQIQSVETTLIYKLCVNL